MEAAPARAEGIDNLAGNVAQLGEELHAHEGRLHGIQTSRVVAMGNDLSATSDIPLLGRQRLEPALHRLMHGPIQRAGAFESLRHPWNEHAKSFFKNHLASREA